MNTKKNAKLLFRALLIICLFGMVGMDAFAQIEHVNRRGTSGAAELLVPLTARTVGLGGVPTISMADSNGL